MIGFSFCKVDHPLYQTFAFSPKGDFLAYTAETLSERFDFDHYLWMQAGCHKLGNKILFNLIIVGHLLKLKASGKPCNNSLDRASP